MGVDNMKRLSSRVILSILLVTVLTALIVVSVTYTLATNAIKIESKEKMESYAKRYVVEINDELENIQTITDDIKTIIEDTIDMEKFTDSVDYMEDYKDKIGEIIKLLAQNTSISKSAYVFFDPSYTNHANDVWYADLNLDGKVERQDEFPIEFYDGNVVEKAWFYIPLKTRKPYWTDPYYGNTEFDNHIYYISYTNPIIVHNKVIAVAGSDYFFSDLVNRIKSIRIYDNGYAFLMDSKGRMLVHPTIEKNKYLSEVNGGEFEGLSREMLSKKEGFIEYTWEGNQDKMMVFSQLENGLVLGLTAPESEIFKTRDELVQRVIIVFIIVLTISMIIGYMLGYRITRPIVESLPQIVAISEGDYNFKIDLKYLSREDEIGKLLNAVEQMRIRQKVSFEKINEYNTALEKRVKERTDELYKTNEYLEVSLAQLEEQQAELLITNNRLEESLEEVKKTQKQLIEAEKIAALGYLVAGISHEINTPLGNCITVTSYLSKEANLIFEKQSIGNLKKSEFDLFLKSTVESISFLDRNLEVTKNLINNFKELAVAKTSINKSNYNIKELLEGIIKLSEAYISEKHVEVRITCDEDMYVTIDSQKFTQIILNLISNSMKHGFEGRNYGEINILIEQRYDSMFIQYSDNGKGIDSMHLKDIFTPFFSTKFSEEYKGLGLNVVYNIVKGTFGGEIECESKLDIGTTFSISLKI